VGNGLLSTMVRVAAASALLALMWLPASAQGPAGRGPRGKKVSPEDFKPSGPPPMFMGKADLSGVWDHPFVIDMSKDSYSNACGAEMKGCSYEGPGGGELPMTAEGKKLFDSYDPANYDPTGHCNPMGYTRSMNAPVPTQIVQRPDEVIFLHESMFAFHVVYTDGRKQQAPADAEQTMWYGHSVGHWDGNTLMVDTVGPFFASPKMLLDTKGHPVSEQLHLTETFRRMDPTHLYYTVTVDDPVMYTHPWSNKRIWTLMKPGQEIMEYVCTENNKEVTEHHIK
jgi:hypothetical protein